MIATLGKQVGSRGIDAKLICGALTRGQAIGNEVQIPVSTQDAGADDRVRTVDLTGDVSAGLSAIRKAAAFNTAVLAILPDTALADAALAAGATHLHLADGALSLEQSLRAAHQACGRVAGVDRERREGDGALAAWLGGLRAGQPATMVRVTLLRLDLVNAAHGREAGTALVAAAERRIASVLEALAADEGDTLLTRVPGPGFAALLAGPPEGAIIAAARVEEALDRPFRIAGASLILGSRIGLAGLRLGDDASALLARADRAMADEGDGWSRVYEGDDEPSLRALAIDLHRALADDQITLRFQPQAHLTSGRVVGVEALARWQHPELGPLSAESLFAAADHAGIALALSDHIQRLVLTQVAAWPAALAHLRVALNLTPGDLARPGFAETFLDRVDASGVPRGRLTLEITETGLMEDLPAAAALLTRLRGAGCRVAIDDFGTGYSSLAWLKALPVDYLKLDKSLAQDIAGTERDRVVVRGAIDMARSLGLAVVAEGIETEEQRALLAAEGCATYQGFLLAEPMDEDELIRWMETR
ncbi:EAL domain, c-di-GMP-specific phosphodiesterase class I (or its enzymatically inactive variant) [Sphingomonas gellani]|uniref:EAL domain, c-di-GMP-specific phosphodiesterase class I (Or its enzymatically inactive variant) n=1 Tax=Sphingomonas gellani TaxID=1166340 RepID=A0A1H7YZW9_9SPHN|nr:GGDEF domain-containing phosphodiesterase [Sphingomonas gellani]SEM50789.1 EAL domain, c-di-GMP-specific phosphodiesterase class I (or its enzymatically inactive variant) [Sphingomonas gellani]